MAHQDQTQQTSRTDPPLTALAESEAAALGGLPAWEMKDRDDPSKNTHLWIVNMALEMVYRLSGSRGAAGKLLKQFVTAHTSQLHKGIWDADYASPYKDWGWAYHFYDPDTGANYLSCTLFPEVCHQTARVWGSKCFSDSLAAFQAGNFEEAAYQLGLSLHFLTDVGQPMHASNFYAIGKDPFNYHSGFEAYAIEWTNRTQPAPIPYEQTIDADSFEGFIYAAAQLAKARAGVICGLTATDQWKLCGFSACAAWQAIVDHDLDLSLQDIRRVTAQYLLMWIQEAITHLPPNQWSMNDLTETAAGPIALMNGLAATGWGNLEIAFQLDPQQHVVALARQPDGSWQSTDLTQQTGAPAPSEQMLTASSAPGSDSGNRGALVAFVGADQHAQAVLLPPGSTSGWQLHDLTDEAGAAPPASSLLVASATGYLPSEQVVFIDANRHLNSVIRVRGESWTTIDLTELTQSPSISGSAFVGFSNDVSGQQMIDFVDAEGQIHEMGGYESGDNPWSGPWSGNLTFAADAPLATGTQLSGWDWWAAGTKQVAFIAADSHIWYLSCPYDQDAGGWTATDLTLAANAPVMDVVALRGFDWQTQGSTHLGVLDRDGHVHLLSNGAAGVWTHADLTLDMQAPPATGQALAAFAHEQPDRMGLVYVDRREHVVSLTAIPGTSARVPD